MENEKPVKPTYDAPRAYCLLARQELGIETTDIKTTVRDTVDSYYRLGLIDPPGTSDAGWLGHRCSGLHEIRREGLHM